MQLLSVYIPEKNPETGITTCYYYFDYSLLLRFLLLITTYTTCYYRPLPTMSR